MTRVEYPDASGINGIEWDFVEVQGNFLTQHAHNLCMGALCACGGSIAYMFG